MSEESFNLVELEGLKDEDIPQELLDELDRELARNAEANRLVKEKEQEAIAARDRAEKSRNLMQEVMGKYDQIRNKVDTTKAVLEASAKQAERRQKLQEDINVLKERAEKAAEEYMQKQVIKELEEAGMGRAGTSIVGSTQTKRNRDYAQTVQRLQDKLKQRKQMRKMEEEAKKVDESDNQSSLPVAELPPPTKEEEVSMAIRAMEFKCAIVQERLDEIKMNEELLATREAQLVAVKRQKEAILAEEQAKRKEEEAKEMRKKVESMMRLLSERKNKLKVTENAIEKKGNVVNKVEKILHSKERKATYTEKKRVERLMFAKVQREKNEEMVDKEDKEDKEVKEDKEDKEHKEDKEVKEDKEDGQQQQGQQESSPSPAEVVVKEEEQ